MPIRSPLTRPILAWRCPQCRANRFTTSSRRPGVGPEHPRYIEVPQPPQQTLPYRPPVKGTLPIPRDVFAHKTGKARANDANIARAAPAPARRRSFEPGSREEWKVKMADARRQNLREGLKGLRARRSADERRGETQRLRREAEQEELRYRPEREDERFTTPSHGLNLEKLLHGSLEDPDRETRVERMKANVAAKEAKKQTERQDSLHTLYMRARSFIVTPEQLDKALDESFGTPEQPKNFEDVMNAFEHNGPLIDKTSVWAYGAPMTVQDMLNRANRITTDAAKGNSNITKDRIRRIAEGLTGGKMGGEGGDSDRSI